MEKKWLIGQGATAVDTLLYCSTPIALDGIIRTHEERITSGGSAANLLVTAAGMGVPCALVAKIGDDAFGRQFRRELLDDHVDDRYLLSCPGKITLHTYVAVEPDGNRTIIVNGGDCYYSLCDQDIPSDALDDAFLFYTDGSPKAGAVALARRAVQRGVPVFYQRESLEREDQPELCRMGEELLAAADIISGGPEIFRQMVGSGEPKALKTVWERYRPANGVIMTAGHHGAYWFDGTRLLHQPIFPVRSVDSTGAGDSFCGGLIFAYYVRGWDKASALRFAAACGAMKCMTPGPRLHAAESGVQAFLEQHSEKVL